MPPRLRTDSIPIDQDVGHSRVTVELSVPELTGDAASARFAEHVLHEGRPTETVIACIRGGVLVSQDLGLSWETIAIPELSDVTLRHSFTTADGMHLLQGDARPAEGMSSPHGPAPVALLDPEWRLVECTAPAHSPWHGSRSIDEAGGTIVYAEYPTKRGRDAASDSRLLRSADGGRSWDVVLLVPRQKIRHFHTVAADPWQPGRWWASSGDGPAKCRVWESIDDGLSWSEISVELPRGELHPAYAPRARSILRHTDIVIRESDLIWGTDDLLGRAYLHDSSIPAGRRAGSRLMHSPKGQPWRPRTIDIVGHPVRSLVDVGPAYLVATEAKGWLGFCPQVLLLWKTEPFRLTPLLTIDNFRQGHAATGFTYSCASRAATDGVLFSYRSATDVFPDGPGILRWRVLFD